MASKITHPIMSSNYFSVVLFFLSAWLVGFFLFSPRIVINSVVLLVFSVVAMDKTFYHLVFTKWTRTYFGMLHKDYLF